MARERKNPRRRLSAYRCMWLMAMFDLPVDTKPRRKAYTQFRKALLKDGFLMLQFSVYARFLPSEEAAETHRRIVRSAIPDLGEVRLMCVTDRQYERMEVFFGKKPRPAEEPPPQIMLF